MAILKTKIVLRNDTAENWLKANPVLLAGEMGVEVDTGLIKIGNGTSTWHALEYANNKFEGTIPSAATHYEGTATLLEDGVTYETDEAVIERVLNGTAAQPDDVFVVRRLIADEKYSHTAYIFNGNAWAAMDGNYNANNIYFDEDFITTADIGVVKVGDTIAAEGKNLTTVLKSILSERKYPEAIAPTAEIKFLNENLIYEVGTEVTPTYRATLTPGSYTYGPDTGIYAQSWTVIDNQQNPVTLTTDEGAFPTIVLGESANGNINAYSVAATATYNEGAMPLDNLGEEYAAARIPAGSASAVTSALIKGYRNYFYGCLTTSSTEEPLTSDIIRGLIAGGAYDAEKTLTINAGAFGAKRVVIAYPANVEREGLKEASLVSSMGIDITENYVKQSNVEVEGANGYAAIPYHIYVYEPALLGADEVHHIILA